MGITPDRVTIPADLGKLLKKLYPQLQQSKLSWHRELPWFVRGFGWVSGITLPWAFGRERIGIYLKHWEPSDPNWVALAVHEAYHALQIQQAAEQYPYHWGSWHPFLLAYLASWTRHGYRRHPLELPAYAYEADFAEAFEELENLDAWEDPEALGVLCGPVPRKLICREARFVYPDSSWRLALGAAILLPAGFIRCMGELPLLFNKTDQV